MTITFAITGYENNIVNNNLFGLNDFFNLHFTRWKSSFLVKFKMQQF